MRSDPYEPVDAGGGLMPGECGENKLAGTGYQCLGRKQQKAIEGWSVGILGAVAILGTAYASLPYSWW
jgi:hypothetical protein